MLDDSQPDRWLASVDVPMTWEARLCRNVFDLTPDDEPHLYGNGGRCFIVADENAWHHHGAAMTASLARYGMDHSRPFMLSGGEATKQAATLTALATAMDVFGLDRLRDRVVILGGGVAHDVGMMAAAQYRRGVEAICVASTLVGAIDTVWAVKNSIDHLTPDGRFLKNRLGHYYPAVRSWIDPTLLRTLPAQEIREGVAEIVKWALAADLELWELLERHGQAAMRERFADDHPDTWQILSRTIAGMMGELEGNPTERNPQRKSYMGHGFSFALEPTLPHGSAVLVDCALAAVIAHLRGLINAATLNRVLNTMQRLDLRTWHPDIHDRDKIAAAMDDITRHRGGRQLIPLLSGGIGRVTFASDITPDEIANAAVSLKSLVNPQ